MKTEGQRESTGRRLGERKENVIDRGLYETKNHNEHRRIIKKIITTQGEQP